MLSASKYRFQEFVLAPMWDRLHPLYLRLFGGHTGASRVGGNESQTGAPTRAFVGDAAPPRSSAAAMLSKEQA